MAAVHIYRRLAALSAIISLAMVALALLGYLGLQKWKAGLKGSRLGDFAQVARQIQLDVKQRLDQFVQTEQARPYTDYLPYHMLKPEPAQTALNQALTLIRSPLAVQLQHGLAYGHFQIQSDGTVITPHDPLVDPNRPDNTAKAIEQIKDLVRSQLLPLLRPQAALAYPKALSPVPQAKQKKAEETSRSLPIDSLQLQQEQPRVILEERETAIANIQAPPYVPKASQQFEPNGLISDRISRTEVAELRPQSERRPIAARVPYGQAVSPRVPQAQMLTTVRIDPLVPIVLNADKSSNTPFGCKVYMVRHVQVEDQHLMQGFQLDLDRLVWEVSESANRLVGKSMAFSVSDSESSYAAYVAILDFGFGKLVLNLIDADPGMIQRQVIWLERWYGIAIVIVIAVVGLGLAGLWHAAWQQVQLSRQKDNFISAVSHELRTPLTAIRMYAEMLEKGWVGSDRQRQHYYHNIHQEGERLTRLIENVLDFSRIQQGHQHYQFVRGDINSLVGQVIERIRPYATELGFTMQTELAPLDPIAFDHDAVTQILVNLIDNAIKFSCQGPERTIIIRTRQQDQHVLIDVEDRGPGVPSTQRKKIFREFYRIEQESTRKSRGVGLGLALAQRFAMVHNGFIQVSQANPNGAIFTVGLNKGLSARA